MQSYTYWKYQAGDKLWTRCIVVFTTIFAIGFSCYIWVSELSPPCARADYEVVHWFPLCRELWEVWTIHWYRVSFQASVSASSLSR